ncbi:tryptophan 7-halogenase [Cuspidothrix issatschenkoi LEGE 03284]|uniref:NAD(P)/FAD-dependent oxidoreductase n=1 Tax=Cuspidothrix issatschenkoi TaxID=230752 RepID=UPI001880C09C|nr:tryptophan 7-halogenase [Cuspidothrix issatschenkoi]MBE9230434.1 tryptophan 7-halogenase [Cuspidothrix issatschenkoi LEGE 03284]
MTNSVFDIAICGGGLAGSTLARQLKLQMPDISIVVLDRLVSPLPQATFKVGESTVYAGAYYLAETLQLTDYFEEHHLPKLGLRYFFGNTQSQFHKRPELGLSDFAPTFKSYQIDRGKLEQDLRIFNRQLGIDILENCAVKDIQLAQNCQEIHQITYTQGKEQKTSQSKWVIDAMGRRRFLQRKLGLDKPNSPNFNAVWFRVKGLIDVADLVPDTEVLWHDRVPKRIRYYSTNHLCGKGYWVWTIPLSSDYTSIGIVAEEEAQPFSEFHTYELACQWLEKNEPVFAAHLQEKQPADFKKMPRYSYSSTQVFSENRWACVGEAGVFPDPLFSPGSDLIGYCNSLLTELVKLDFQGDLSQKQVTEANNFFLNLSEGTTSSLHGIYSYLDQGVIFATRFIWDVVTATSNISRIIFYQLLISPEERAKMWPYSEQISQLTNRLEQLFLDWSTKSLGRISFEFIDYWTIPILKEVRNRSFTANKVESEIIEDGWVILQRAEEVAQAIFLLALQDTMPDQLTQFSEPIWLNAWAISLDTQKWQQERLFQPKSQPRDISWAVELFDQVFSIS